MTVSKKLKNNELHIKSSKSVVIRPQTTTTHHTIIQKSLTYQWTAHAGENKSLTPRFHFYLEFIFYKFK